MDRIRAEEAKNAVHSKATNFQRAGDHDSAEKVYRDALLIYPTEPCMILGLAGTLALKGNYREAIDLMERGLPLSEDEKQKATMRAVLCFLYLKSRHTDKAACLASTLPHKRECREEIQPLIARHPRGAEIDETIKKLLLGT